MSPEPMTDKQLDHLRQLAKSYSPIRSTADIGATLTAAVAEVERLRGDVREYRRQLQGLGVAAGRGEPLDTAAAGEATA